ncbi:hypothetical protein [Siphonobacter curvatus]|uniref:Uncharacterized protein n=1 Tax=Siphonobacter curvatus TaxID=2094562 RepID=A0A2S7IP18_9BACT|nr:hypothetical protein [Siphonobacter curvatus]PQA59419.1 hypothetical protein C5O19_07140 [Siphonobacter curvatus]
MSFYDCPIKVNKLYTGNGMRSANAFDSDDEMFRFQRICEQGATERLALKRPEDEGKTYNDLVSDVWSERFMYRKDWLTK